MTAKSRQSRPQSSIASFGARPHLTCVDGIAFEFQARWSLQFMSDKTTSSSTVRTRAILEQSPPKRSLATASHAMQTRPEQCQSTTSGLSTHVGHSCHHMVSRNTVHPSFRKLLTVLARLCDHHRHEIPRILKGPKEHKSPNGGSPHKHDA